MQITTTITLNVSPENEWLIPTMIHFNGVTNPGESQNDCLKRLRNEATQKALENQIVPYLGTFFGLKDIAMAEQVEHALKNGGIEVETTIS